MEKVIFLRRYVTPGLRFGLRRTFGLYTVIITDEKFKISLFGMPMMKEMLSDISSIRVGSVFQGDVMTIKLKQHDRKEVIFRVPEAWDLVRALESLNIKVEYDAAALRKEAQRASNVILKIMKYGLGIGLLIFLIYIIVSAVR